MSWKHGFDLGDSAYLNGANHGPLPRVALAAAEEALGWKRNPAVIDDTVYFTLPDRVRRAAAPFFACEPQDLAVTTGATPGVSLLVSGLDWREGDRVVLPEGEFPANYLPWMSLRAQGVELDFVSTEGGLTCAAIEAALTPRTRVVALGYVNFATGFRADARAIGELCRDRDIAYLIDASQGACAVPLDAPACHATIVAAAGYKWMLSPYGTGVFYVDPAWVERLPVPAVNWLSVEGADDFNQLTSLELDFRPGAVRWDAAETASFFNCMPMAASLEFLGEIGVEQIFAHATGLIDQVAEGLPAGFQGVSSLEIAHRSSIFRFVGETDASNREAYERCLGAGISLSLRESGLRVSPGVWNDSDDVDRLLRALSG